MAWLSVTLETDCAHARSARRRLDGRRRPVGLDQDAAAGTADENRSSANRDRSAPGLGPFAHCRAVRTPPPMLLPPSTMPALSPDGRTLPTQRGGGRAELGAADTIAVRADPASPTGCGSCLPGTTRRIRMRSIWSSIPGWPVPDRTRPPACAWKWLERTVAPGGTCSTMAAAPGFWQSPPPGWAPARSSASISTRRRLLRQRPTPNATPSAPRSTTRAAAGRPVRHRCCQYPRQPAEGAGAGDLRPCPCRQPIGAVRHPEEQADELIGIYSEWLPLAVADTREGWVCLAGRKPETAPC